MDFKKLNEDLEKHIINEISLGLKQRVLDKRQQQLQDLEKEENQDLKRSDRLERQIHKFAQELINRTVLCKIDGKEVKLVFDNDDSGPLYVRLSENNIFKGMYYRLQNYDKKRRVYDVDPSQKFTEKTLKNALTRECYEYDRKGGYPVRENLSMLDCMSTIIISAIKNKEISSFEIVYEPFKSIFSNHLSETIDSFLSYMEDSVSNIKSFISVCPWIKNHLSNENKNLLSGFTGITESLQINEIATKTIYNAHRKALRDYDNLNKKFDTYDDRRRKLQHKIDFIQDSIIGQEKLAKMEKKKETIFNSLQKIAMKAFKDYGYKVYKEDYDADEAYPHLLRAEAVDDELEMYIDKSDLDRLTNPEFFKEVTKEGFECDATIQTASMGFEDSDVTLHTKDIPTSIENIQAAIDGLIEEAHVAEENQDEWDDVDLSPAK